MENNGGDALTTTPLLAHWILYNRAELECITVEIVKKKQMPLANIRQNHPFFKDYYYYYHFC